MNTRLNAAEILEDTPESASAPDIHDLIRNRWSPRSFSTREISDDDLRSVFEAARWSASSYNEQPWRFFVARRSDSPAFEKLLNLLVPANRSWARSAPVLIITAAKKTFSHSGSPNYYALHDTGQALANLSMQATALGLHVHAMGGFDHELARRELRIPSDYEVGAAVALGYSEAEKVERQRKPIHEIVFGAGWEEPLHFSAS